MPFPEKFITEVKERNDIVDVVSEYVALTKRSGSNIFGLCPFHGEKTPSFSVSRSRQIYHCFGCGKGGGVINFIMDIENLSYRDAVAKLAERAGLQMPVEAEDPNSKKRDRMFEVNKAAARFFHDMLLSPEGLVAQNYIAERQISKTSCTNFGLGFAPDSWDCMRNALKQQGFSDFEMFDAGLLKRGKNGGFYDAFRNRLMFPVIDVRGKVIGFSGRTLGGSEQKYYNSPNTLVFDKGRNLFGLNIAKKSKADYIILVEGNIDVVSLHQAGFDSAVATLGTALTEQQAQLIKRYNKDEIVLAYDSDIAGVKATSRAISIFDKLDMKVKVLKIEGAKDPDEYIKKHGSVAFQKLIEDSENRTDYRLRLIENRYDLSRVDERVGYTTEAIKLVAMLPTAAERQIYSSVIAEKASVKTDAVAADVEKVRRSLERSRRLKEQRNATSERTVNSHRYSNPDSAAAEEGIIRLLYLDSELVRAGGLPEEAEFTDERLSKIYAAVRSSAESGSRPDIDVLSEVLDTGEISILVDIVSQPENLSRGAQTLAEYVESMRRSRKKTWTDISDILKAKQEKEKEIKR